MPSDDNTVRPGDIRRWIRDRSTTNDRTYVVLGLASCLNDMWNVCVLGTGERNSWSSDVIVRDELIVRGPDVA